MKFTEQTTINREFTTYSDPITKYQAAELWTRILEGTPEDLKIRLATKFSHLDDLTFIKSFNKTLNIRIRLYAPGLYQITYNETHIFN